MMFPESTDPPSLATMSLTDSPRPRQMVMTSLARSRPTDLACPLSCLVGRVEDSRSENEILFVHESHLSLCH